MEGVALAEDEYPVGGSKEHTLEGAGEDVEGGGEVYEDAAVPEEVQPPKPVVDNVSSL